MTEQSSTPPAATGAADAVGVVVIGRNEGERLRRCLAAVRPQTNLVVYVDSGSTDNSVAFARDIGAIVVELDMSQPFTAARARNRGFDELMKLAANLEFVQFVDGDCEMKPGWIAAGVEEMRRSPGAAVVFGDRHEIFPDASIYNRLCEIEWDTPLGEVNHCGGDSMMRVSAFKAVGGFNPSVIAGEEPDLCFRLRQKGWKILRIEAAMTNHDVAMTRFGQWWKRNVRAGHAYAQAAEMNGHAGEGVREVRSNYLWGFVLPLGIIIASALTHGLALLLLALYPLLGVRVNNYARRRGFSKRDARLYGAFIVLGKFPQAIGQLKYLKLRLLGRKPSIIEYKDVAAAASPAPAAAK